MMMMMIVVQFVLLIGLVRWLATLRNRFVLTKPTQIGGPIVVVVVVVIVVTGVFVYDDTT